MELSEDWKPPEICPWAGVCGRYTPDEIVVVMAIMDWLGIRRFNCRHARACLNLIMLFHAFLRTR